MLRCGKRSLSEVKPISVWIPEAVTRRFIEALEDEYNRRLLEAGGDLEVCEDWAVEDYKPSTALVKYQRDEWTDAMHRIIVTTGA